MSMQQATIRGASASCCLATSRPRSTTFGAAAAAPATRRNQVRCQAAKAPLLEHATGTDRSKNPLLELQRLALEAQAEKDLWEAQLSQHELQQQQLKAQLDARARHQAQCRDALSSLRQLLHAARHVAREQHLAVFAESVHHCGRQRLRQEREGEREEHRAYVQASMDAAEQLQDYEASLTRMVGAVMASMAAAESLPVAWPSLITGDAPSADEEEGQQQQRLAAPVLVPVLAAGRNNIVPRKPATAALMQRRAAGAGAPTASA